jgi:hypothetical protein
MTGLRMEVGGKNIMKCSFVEVEGKEENCGTEKPFGYLNGLEKNKYIQTTCGNQHSLVRSSSS